MAKVAGVLCLGPSPIEGDALGYWRLSELAMQGDWLMRGEPIAYRTPVYPWLLAAVRTISPWPLATVVILQGGMYVATVWIVALLAVRISGFQVAGAITWAASLPMLSAITFTSTVLTETLFVFLLVLHLLAVDQYARSPGRGRSAWAGATFALLVLTRPIAIHLWAPSLGLFLAGWWIGRKNHVSDQVVRGGKLRCADALLAVLTVILLLSPWLYRNHSMFGRAMLTEFVGRNVWIVTFQDGSGAGLGLPLAPDRDELVERIARQDDWSDWEQSERWRLTWPVSNALVGSGLSDPEADRLMRRVALKAASGNRVAFAKKAFRRVVNFWRTAATDLPPQGPATGDFQAQRAWGIDVPPVSAALWFRWSRSVLLNTILLLLTAASVAFLLLRVQTRASAVWIALVLLYFSAVTGILEIPAYRYRIVIEPLVLLMCSISVSILVSKKASPPSESA